MFMSKILPKAKVIAFILSFVIIAGIGLTYMLMSDFLLSNAAIWLLIASVCSFGSAICIILSSNYKEKPVTMYILIGVAILLTILFLVTIYSFAQMPLTNDKIIYNEDGTVKEKIMGVTSYIREFNKNGNGEGLPEMPKFLTVVEETKNDHNNVVKKNVCKETMFYIPIKYTGNTPLETLKASKTFNTERNFNTVVVLCKVFGYTALAVQAAYVALCVVVKEQ